MAARISSKTVSLLMLIFKMMDWVRRQSVLRARKVLGNGQVGNPDQAEQT